MPLVPVDHDPFETLTPVDYDPFAAEKFANPAVQGAITSLATLPQRAIQNSQYSLDTGNYDPGPTLEAATLPMGTGAIAGVPVRAGEAVLGSGAVRGVESGMRETPQELYHVVGEDYKSGDPLRSLYSRKGNAAYDEYAARWPEAGDLVQYHPHQNFFYDTLADAQNHASDFGGKILKVEPSKVEGLHFDKNEGFWTTRDDVPPDALSPFGKANSATAGIGPAATPIRAYHGSPHDFDAFSMDKIGTGEGAQAYGHGLYFAENEGTAKSYRDGLSAPLNKPANRLLIDGQKLAENPDFQALPLGVQRSVNSAMSLGATKDQALKNVLYQKAQSVKGMEENANNPNIANLYRPDYHDQAHDFISKLPDNIVDTGHNPGKMYEVNINADPADFLDWDKPLSEQHPVVQEAVTKQLKSQPGGEDLVWRGPSRDVDSEINLSAMDPAERKVNERLLPKLGGEIKPRWQHELDRIGPQSVAKGDDQIAKAQMLREAGIPGIKYLDQGSRASGDGSRNYVVFNDKLIDIVKKYAAAGIALPPAIAAEYQRRFIPVDHDPFAESN
jgi:hypothetical protein